MRKVIYLSVTIMVSIFLWLGFYYIGDKGVTLNPMIEDVVKEQYETEKVSKRLIESIEVLDLSYRNLISIEGLEYFLNLKDLNLSGNLLTDVSELAELANLKKLNLSFNQLNGVTLTSEALEDLNLEANRLVTVDFVGVLPNLKKLNLRANQIADVTPLESLQKLKALNIRGNQVKSLEALSGLKKLNDLNARNNQITIIEPIAKLPLAKRLYLSGNEINDLDLLQDRLETFDDYDFEIPIPQPEFRIQSGVYTEPFELELRTAKHHQIYYTLDGSNPSIRAHKYEGTINISDELLREGQVYANYKTSPLKEEFSFGAEDVKKAVTVTAVSYTKGEFSKPLSQTYILDETLFQNDLPVVSLTVNPKDFFDEDGGIYVPGNMYEAPYNRTGNYYQKGRAHEKEGTIEYFNEDGTIGFRQRIGLRINGSYTRVLPQKSLRIYPRSDYGQSRIYSKIFEDLPYHEFNMLVLRSSGNDNDSTMLRDGLMNELVKERGIDVQAYRPAIVLINGEYWGIHNLREKFNEDYVDIKYNVKQSDLAMLSITKQNGKLDFTVDAGNEKDRVHYYNMLEFMRANDMTQDVQVDYVNTQMDIDNYLEYVAYEVYYGNTDSFYNNLSIWRKRTDYVPDAPLGHDGRWRWMLFDLDWGMGYGLLAQDGDPIAFNMLEFLTRDDPSVELFKLLMENKGLKDQFTSKVLTLLNENFSPENVQDKIDELAANIRPEMSRSITRWENIESVEMWEENIALLQKFAQERPDHLRRHLKEIFGYTDEELNELTLIDE